MNGLGWGGLELRIGNDRMINAASPRSSKTLGPNDWLLTTFASDDVLFWQYHQLLSQCIPSATSHIVRYDGAVQFEWLVHMLSKRGAMILRHGSLVQIDWFLAGLFDGSRLTDSRFASGQRAWDAYAAWLNAGEDQHLPWYRRLLTRSDDATAVANLKEQFAESQRFRETG